METPGERYGAWLRHRAEIAMSDLIKLRALAKLILQNAVQFKWSLQGLGMLRLHIDDVRLHVWDTRFAFPGATPIHDHQQWALHSTILSGCMMNYRYLETNVGGESYMYKTIRAGYGTFDLHESRAIQLIRQPVEFYYLGQSYSQEPFEIHESRPDPGTVSVMLKMSTTNAQDARVFWPAGTEWGSAEPRAATIDEVQQMTSHALRVWK